MNPNSSATSYLTVSDFLSRHDARLVAQFCSDTPPPGNVTVAQLPTDPNLAAALATASGMLESAVLRSGRYSAIDLHALVTQGGVSAEYMKSIVSDVAMYKLMCRRGGPAPSDSILNSYEEAIKALNDLSEGIRIFAFQEVEAAGVASTKQFTPTDYQMNNLVTARWPRMFGNRQNARRFL